MAESNFNENLTTLIDEFDMAHADHVGNKDLTAEARRRNALSLIDQAEDLLVKDDHAFEAAVEEKRSYLTGVLEAGHQHFGPKHGPDAVAAMMSAQAAVSSGDARVIIQAHEDALKAGDEAALTILERSGAAAMPSDALRDEYKERVKEAKEARKHPKIREAESALADFEARAERAAYARSMIRSSFVNKLREYKRP